MLDSLRRDVAAHPSDFITFETEASAGRFLAEHANEAYRETQPQVISRGILGYWGGKTLVVLPSLARISPLGLTFTDPQSSPDGRLPLPLQVDHAGVRTHRQRAPWVHKKPGHGSQQRQKSSDEK